MNVRGLTTAANLGWSRRSGRVRRGLLRRRRWSAAALALLALWPLRVAAGHTVDRWRREDTHIVLDVRPSFVEDVLEEFSRRKLRIQRFDIEREGELRRLTLRLDHANPALAASLGELDGVVEASWGT